LRGPWGRDAHGEAMSIGKRIIDLARANLNALLDKAGEEDHLAELSDDELKAELERRREKRERETQERENAERAAAEARRRASGAPPRSTAPPQGTRTPPSTPPKNSWAKTSPPKNGPKKPPFWAQSTAQEKRLRELYSQLEVPYGAPFDEVKKSFRRLMRKYHPDLHAGNPEQHQTATKLTMSLTQAYRELERHLLGRT
jgi:DnaJ-domain-containing protein 1